MSRVQTGDVVVRKADNNIYTVLVFAGTVVVLLGLIVIFSRGLALGIKWMG